MTIVRVKGIKYSLIIIHIKDNLLMEKLTEMENLLGIQEVFISANLIMD